MLINDRHEVLISDEREYGMDFTKFPGGGVAFGEGLIEALKREFIEECNAEIEVISHFYTTDFYEKSSFNESQVISVYYLVKEVNPLELTFKEIVFDFDENSTQSFRWVKCNELKIEDMTFKTDQAVVALIHKLEF